MRAILTLVVIPCLYIREVTSKRKRGPGVTYVQLCESEWDAQKGSARSRILHSFGRKDELDVRQIARLSAQLRAYLDTENLGGSVEGVDLTDPWDFGGPHLLDGLWRDLGLDDFFSHALRDRRFDAPVERAILAMVTQRALAPDSKLAGARWAGSRAWIPGLGQGGEELKVQHFYRAMDFLAGAMDELREHLYFQVTDLLNADVLPVRPPLGPESSFSDLTHGQPLCRHLPSRFMANKGGGRGGFTGRLTSAAFPSTRWEPNLLSEGGPHPLEWVGLIDWNGWAP